MSLIKTVAAFLILVALVYLGQFTLYDIEYNEPSLKTVYEIPSTFNINVSQEDWLALFKDKSTKSYKAEIKINDSETVNGVVRFGGQSTRERYQYNSETKDISAVTLHARIHRWLRTNLDFKLSPFDEDPSLMRLKFGHDFFGDIFNLNRNQGLIPRTNYAYVNLPPAPQYLGLVTEPIDKIFFKIRNQQRTLRKSPDRLKIMTELRRDLFPKYKDYFEENYFLTYILIEYFLNSENPLLSYGDSENYDLYYDSYSKKTYPIPNDLDAVIMSCSSDISDKWNIFNEDRYSKALTNLYKNSENKKELNYLLDSIYKKIYTENYGLTLAEKNLNSLKKCCSNFMAQDHEKHYKELLNILECQRQKFDRLIKLTKNQGNFLE